MTSAPQLDELGINGFRFNDLYDPFRLRDLHSAFDAFYQEQFPEAFSHFDGLRTGAAAGLSYPAQSEILLHAARVLELFVAKLFHVNDSVESLRASLVNERIVTLFKSNFLKRAILRKKDKPADTSEERFTELSAAYSNIRMNTPALPWNDEELALALLVWHLGQVNDESVPAELQQLLQGELHAADKAKEVSELLEDYYFLRKILQPQTLATWISSRTPKKIDFDHLVHAERPRTDLPELIKGDEHHYRRRDGFKLTDRRFDARNIMYEVDYCMICHEREKDSCSKGSKDASGALKKNPLGIALQGCPLDEHISEMHALKRDGYSVGALAMITINNPMCAGTGHRICNDCMKGCIFQKQEPVNIPAAETSALTDVLDLPWGFEIYALLTRWNPLNLRRPYALPYNGKKILVVGLGPAGYTLAHHLLNEGFAVVAVEGLKVEPLPETLVGSRMVSATPVYDYHREIEQELDERVLEGFGGVSEYGITVRWDKNFLTVLHTLLCRRRTFKILDGVRFGGTLTIEDAWELGFDHIGLAAGAGKPTIIPMKNNLSRGIRKASDFLMSLQLTGAAKLSSMANYQMRLPVVVIGGGLTGIDTTTEAMAYYPLHVQKFYQRASVLVAEHGEQTFWSMFDAEEREVAQEFFEHGRAIVAERERAHLAGEQPNFIPLLQSWGGVTMAYRKRMQDSPAYRLNHEEIEKALEEGVYILECMNPLEARLDEHKAVRAMVFERYRTDENGRSVATGETVELPARSVFVAAGTSPNTMYEKEFPSTFVMDNRNQYFAAYQAVVDTSQGVLG
ncbi:MAG: FAD-dependent oxidoreductase [Candidatus Kapaibacterium sp.]